MAEEWGENLILYLYDADGTPIGMQYRNTSYAEGVFDTYWFEKNLQGDIVAVYDQAGTKLIAYTYDAWGNASITYSNGGASTTATYNPFRYRGYYFDSESGFYYLNSRYYDPAIGRFISPDSYINANGDLLGFNMYAYCGNNPVIFADYSGKSVILVIGGIAITEKVMSALFATVSVAVIGIYAISQTQVNSSQTPSISFPQAPSSESKISRKELVGIVFGSTIDRIIKREDAKIHNIVEHSTRTRYWTATVHPTYVSLGRPLTYVEAIQKINQGHSVFTVTSREAMALALSASKNYTVLNKEIDAGKENTKGFYWHYHPEPRNGGHVYFLLP